MFLNIRVPRLRGTDWKPSLVVIKLVQFFNVYNFVEYTKENKVILRTYKFTSLKFEL